MANITTFVTGTPIMKFSGPTATFTSGGAIKAGQVVAINATGASWTVNAAVAQDGERPIGVALTSATDAGQKITVALAGSICLMTNADNTTAIDAGDHLETNANPVGGTVNAASVAASGGALAILNDRCIGIALEDIAGGGYGYCLVLPHSLTRANSS